jgi:hypothetical protein
MDLRPLEEISARPARSVADVMPRVLKEHLRLDQRQAEGEIAKVWKQMVDPNVSAHARPDGLARGTLFVSVDSSVWLDEIVRYRRKEILDRLQHSFGRTMIKRISFRVGCLFLVAGLAIGCQKQPPPPAPAPEPVVEQTIYLPHAQRDLPVVKLWVGPEELSAEVCLTQQQLATGMMFRTNLAEKSAMLFCFGIPHQAAFYMRNTTVPLSAAYIDPEGVIVDIRDLKPLDETSVEASSDQIQFVLEVNQGWFTRHGITTGAVVRSSAGSLRDIPRALRAVR